jgi:hypothetical protein
MSNIAVAELIEKVQQLDLFFYEAGFERTDSIRFSYKLDKEYRANLIVYAPSDDEDYDND